MADEDDKRPKPEFNEVAPKPEKEVTFEADFDDDLQNNSDEPLRGNTDPKHDPKYERNSGYTPMGSGPSLGAASRYQSQTLGGQSEARDTQISDEEWQHQLRNGNHTFEQEFNGLRVRTWQTDHPTKEGIHGGRLNKMIVTNGEYGHENKVAIFEKGDWTTPPETTLARQTISDAVQEYDPDCIKVKSQTDDRDGGNEKKKGKDWSR